MAHKSRNADEVLGRLARRSPVLTRGQLLGEGLSHDEIAYRIRAGLLAKEYPGVYRLGPPTVYTRYLAAVKACGAGAVLSGLAAAWWWGLVRGGPPMPEVSAPTERRIRG